MSPIGRHGNDGDRAAVFKLYYFLIQPSPGRCTERSRHAVFGGDLVHPVGDNAQRIRVEGHIGEQNQYLFVLVHCEILRGGERHIMAPGAALPAGLPWCSRS